MRTLQEPFPYLGIFTADDSGCTRMYADEIQQTAVGTRPYPYLGIFTADDSGCTRMYADEIQQTAVGTLQEPCPYRVS
ncbi:MAG: hypothetical protein U7126_23925 [Microcoleus sp.]